MTRSLRARWLIATVLVVYAPTIFAANAFDKVGDTLFGSAFGISGTNATYDYVIVGGGTAGLTIASRLVEQNAGSVAVVEAGTFYELSNGNHSQVPATASYYVGKDPNDWQPSVDWGYVTTPQAGCKGLLATNCDLGNMTKSVSRGLTMYQCIMLVPRCSAVALDATT